MKNVLIMCEGDTEVNFVKNILNIYFHGKIIFYPVKFITSFNRRKGQTKKGGIPNYESVKNQIENFINENHYNYITTMIDYYGIAGQGFPNNQYNDIYDKIDKLEEKFNEDIELIIKRNNKNIKFFAYFQLYEFETLLFSDLDKLPLVEPEWSENELKNLKNSVKSFNNIELINNNPKTAPSKRLGEAFKVRYNKIIHSTSIIEKIGVDNIRDKCRHFNEWLDKIENILE